MDQPIGIFPLQLVLFPEAAYPLHIFETRYRALVADSIEQDRPFGINLVDRGSIFDVGCTVKVTRVTREYPDGRRDIVVEGIARYRIEQMERGPAGYLIGTVAPVRDEAEDPDEMLARTAVERFNELVDAVYGAATLPLDETDWKHRVVSFRIAQKSGIELVARQKLLEMTSENNRLAALCDHLDRILPKVRAIDQIRKISRNDGYLPGSSSEPPSDSR